MRSKLPASAKIIFISDAHLGGFSPEKNARIEKKLVHLVQYAKENGFLIAILGDLFDYWMEYPNYIPSVGKRVLQHFEQLNDCKSTLYITGNHDNWTEGYFAELNFDVEPDSRSVTIGSQNVLLLHGDAIGEKLDNLKRPLLHRLMRNKTFVKWYQTILPPEAGVDLMKEYSRFTNFLAASETDPGPLDNWSEKMLKNNDIDVIICGHDHIPRVHKYNFGTYLNLGTFHYHKTLVVYSNRQFRLVCWNEQEQKLTPYPSLEIEA